MHEHEGGPMSTLLKVEGLVSGYGRSQVLYGMRLQIDAGQCVTLLGRNGMGKTTTIKSIMGMHPVWQGQVQFNGAKIQNLPSHRVAQRGVGLVPEGRQIFPNLSVEENLVATAADRRRKRNPWTLRRIYELFPRLRERAGNFGNQLSGGEQQMLAIGRALMTNPELLILDEATEGLSPLVRQEIWAALAVLRREGMAILVIDKNLAPLLRLADRHYIVEKGQIVWEGDSDALGADPQARQKYLGA
ncbi:Branched-chain amino acid transport ATP-binding protein LivF [Castellaniella defragrans 65Phen]|uniref:Branched-chain amino acid transport ATP-binding protein LivF n=2 Tax=Castellaniella defragrans TaxID=75697 RepID=W8X1F9_CASD6|nr:ABC transporter ATP-binding protein [Castellaniella defragrans]CDM22716.1 Branched-chain amino acid transport ATP-binding protein LivF [Castellaniella defragrans 65Phen]